MPSFVLSLGGFLSLRQAGCVSEGVSLQWQCPHGTLDAHLSQPMHADMLWSAKRGGSEPGSEAGLGLNTSCVTLGKVLHFFES